MSASVIPLHDASSDVAMAPGVIMTMWPESPGRDKQVE